MSLCLNPQCGSSQNPAHSLQCRSCGMPLRLKHRYRSLKLLGQGGFGKTFLAVDEAQSHKPRCVIKQFLLSDRPERFRQEAQKLSTLGQHPQIPALLDFVETAVTTYLVQEFIDGENLQQRLDSQGPFSPQDIVSILHEVLPTLHAIHSKKVIHRDIKPANLIKPRSGKLCLVDFGAAKTLTGTRMVQTGTIIGSACFTAPEQTIGKAIYASDIYSLGVTCIYLLTQIPPFTLYDISEGAWVWQDYLTQPVPESLSRVLNKMLTGPTKHRYSSCADVLTDLPGVTPVKVSSSPRSTRPQVVVKSANPNPSSSQSPAISISSQSSESSPAPKQNPLKLKIELMTSLVGHTRAINAVALSPNRQHIATAGADGYIRLWFMASGQARKVLMEGEAGAFDTLDFSPDGELLAAAGWDGTIRIWQTVSGSEVCKLHAHDGTVNTLQFSPDGQWLASGGYDGNIYLWKKSVSQKLFWTHLLQFKSMEVIQNPHDGWVTDLTFSPDSQTLVSVGWNGTAKVWAIPTGRPILTLDNNKVMMQSIVFHPNGKTLATAAGNDRAITLWNIESGERGRTLAGKSFLFTQAVFTVDGRQLVAACSDGQIRTFNVNQGGCSYREVAHSKSVTALAIRGRTVVTGSADKMAKVWMLRKSI